jgi:hypothetical protein
LSLPFFLLSPFATASLTGLTRFGCVFFHQINRYLNILNLSPTSLHTRTRLDRDTSFGRRKGGRRCLATET